MICFTPYLVLLIHNVREPSISKLVQLLATKLGARLFRNNVGLFYTKHGEPVRTGLAVGSSDYIGWHSITVTEKMIGKKLAIFLACEIKREGKNPTEKQQLFLNAVKNSGGISLVAKNEHDFEGGLIDFTEGLEKPLEKPNPRTQTSRRVP